MAGRSKRVNPNRIKVKITIAKLRALADYCGDSIESSYGCIGEYYGCSHAKTLRPYEFREETYEREPDWVCRGLCQEIADQLPEGWSPDAK